MHRCDILGHRHILVNKKIFLSPPNMLQKVYIFWIQLVKQTIILANIQHEKPKNVINTREKIKCEGKLITTFRSGLTPQYSVTFKSACRSLTILHQYWPPSDRHIQHLEFPWNKSFQGLTTPPWDLWSTLCVKSQIKNPCCSVVTLTLYLLQPLL